MLSIKETNYWVQIGEKELGVVAHICNPSIQETEAGRSQVQSQPVLYSKTLS
jgi:hypothetical protein